MGETPALSATSAESKRAPIFLQQNPISHCISLFEDTDLWQPAECLQRMQTQHGGTDGRFVPSYEEADHGRGEDFSDSPAPAAPCAGAVRSQFPQPTGTTCSPGCSLSASCFPDSLLLLGDLSKLSCQYFLFTFSLFQLSELSVSKFSFPKKLGPFLPEPCGMAKTWPHLSPAAQTSPPRPTCKGQSVFLLQEPSCPPGVIVPLLARTERLVLSTLWESTCGRGVKSTFLQLSSEKRGSQARVWAAGGCFIAGGGFSTPL